jgi:hypothetical protein
MNELLKTSATLVAASLLVACSSEESLPQIDVEDSPEAVLEQRAGSLLAEFHHPRQGRDGGLSVHAQFLDVRGMPVTMAMDALEVWLPDTRLEPASCRISTPSWAKPVAGYANLGLHLLDVGPITLDSPTHRLRLDGRRLPDLLGAFHGVLYDLDLGVDGAGESLPYFPLSRYQFHAPGLRETGPFAVALLAPEPIELYEVSHHHVGHDGLVRLPAGQDLVLRWSTDSLVAMDVYIDVATGVGPDHRRLKCRAEDDGSFVIPAVVLETILDETAGVDVTIRRVHSVEADVEGLDEARFTMAATDQITIVFE